MEIAVEKFGIESENQVESFLSRIHVWRPENIQEIINKWGK